MLNKNEDMCTFNDIPAVLDTLVELVSRQTEEIRALRSQLDDLKGECRDRVTHLVFGIWRPGEVVRASDTRLWEGENAPFKSYYAVRKSRAHGCPWKSVTGRKTFCILAQDLELWVTHSSVNKKSNANTATIFGGRFANQ